MILIDGVQWRHILCCVSSIDVVCGIGSSTSSLPLDPIKWDAKRVLTIVDFPRPVCPTDRKDAMSARCERRSRGVQLLAYEHHVEPESTLEKLVLDLLGDG
jgi:hypothetical protein